MICVSVKEQEWNINESSINSISKRFRPYKNPGKNGNHVPDFVPLPEKNEGKYKSIKDVSIKMYFTQLKWIENKSYPPSSKFKPQQVEKQALKHGYPTINKVLNIPNPWSKWKTCHVVKIAVTMSFLNRIWWGFLL